VTKQKEKKKISDEMHELEDAKQDDAILTEV
jgi:hypothetical protein